VREKDIKLFFKNSRRMKLPRGPFSARAGAENWVRFFFSESRPEGGGGAGAGARARAGGAEGKEVLVEEEL